ncbi:Ubiquitin-40S ribosomal protein S27a-1 [Bienertia sinuspersici]
MGGKKHKKKTFTTPKKNHHEKKKEPLAILKLYKIDDDSGNLQRLRKECPSPQCGAGSFMASHVDRFSCGNCGLTYVFNTDSEVLLDQVSDNSVIVN